MLLPWSLPFALYAGWLDGHEAEELSEERDEHDRDQDGRDVLDHDAPRCTPTELR